MHSKNDLRTSAEWRTHITQAVRGLLENPNEPVSELSYFDCIESVMENSKVTGDGGGAKRLPELCT